MSIARDDRERLAATFDRAAGLYQRARPEYPSGLFDRLVEVTGLTPGDRVLEVGAATGKATIPLAQRGLQVTAIEMGPNLAVAARANLAGHPNAEVIQARFEDWDPPSPFDAVVAATAWQWIDPTVRYQQAWRTLRPTGHLAFWDAVHVIPEGGDMFFADIQDVYDEIGESLPPGTIVPGPGDLPDRRGEIEASGWFDVVDICQFDWERVYDAEGYIELLDTFSGHIAMWPWQRDRLYGEVRRRLSAREDGLLRRHWGVVLHVARRRG